MTRFLTVLAVLGLCVLAIPRGWDIVRVWAAAKADVGPDGYVTEAVRPWNGVSGLAFTVREFSLTYVGDVADENLALRRRDEIMEILSIRPLSTEYWLSLSEMRLLTGAHSSKVVEALGLSVLTGANEGYAMSRRGFFGLSHWEVLPAEIQKRTASDFVVGDPLPYRRTEALRTILTEKKEEIRQDMRIVLQAEGFLPKSFADIGL